MSVKAITAIFASGIQPAPRRLTMLALGDFLNEKTGQCNPSLETLAQKVGLSRSQVQKIMVSLKRDGLVTVVRESTGPGVAPEYALDLGRIKAWTERGRVPRTPRGRADSTPIAPKSAERGSVDAQKGSCVRDPTGTVDASKGVLRTAHKPEGEPESEPEGNRSVVAVAPTAAAVRTATALTLSDWILQEKQAGNALFPDESAFHVYADSIKLPRELRLIAWHAFRSIYVDERPTTVALDWRASMLEHIRSNLLRLWWFDASDQAYKLTTLGHQARLALETKQAALADA